MIKNNVTKQRNNTRCISNNAVHKKHKQQDNITLPKIVNSVAMASDESELKEISENSNNGSKYIQRHKEIAECNKKGGDE